jgi:hypothetical protein
MERMENRKAGALDQGLARTLALPVLVGEWSNDGRDGETVRLIRYFRLKLRAFFPG